MKYSTLFFDLDDTLWDTAANSYESLHEIYHRFLFDRYYESFDDFYQVYLPYNMSLWELYEKHRITKKELMGQRFFTPFRHINDMTEAKAMEINAEFMERTSAKSRVIYGAVELLEELEPHYKLHILSNGFEEVQDKKLRSAGLDSYFDKVILSDHIGVNKPDPALFRYALNEAQVNQKEVVMIGDNWSSDIVGARNSGIDQIWFNPDDKQQKEFTPTYTVKNLSEIRNILM